MKKMTKISKMGNASLFVFSRIEISKYFFQMCRSDDVWCNCNCSL